MSHAVEHKNILMIMLLSPHQEEVLQKKNLAEITLDIKLHHYMTCDMPVVFSGYSVSSTNITERHDIA
jgi:hypothetical protein